MVKHAPINYSDFHSWLDFHWGGGGGGGDGHQNKLNNTKKPSVKSYAHKLNSMYTCT